MELVPLKVGVGHGIQFGKGVAGQRRHIPIHIWQRGMELRHRPAPIGIVIQTNQVFFLYIELHCHTSNSSDFSRVGGFLACSSLAALSCARMDGFFWRWVVLAAVGSVSTSFPPLWLPRPHHKGKFAPWPLLWLLVLPLTGLCSAGGGWTSPCSPGFSPRKKLPSGRQLLSLGM